MYLEKLDNVPVESIKNASILPYYDLQFHLEYCLLYGFSFQKLLSSISSNIKDGSTGRNASLIN